MRKHSRRFLGIDRRQRLVSSARTISSDVARTLQRRNYAGRTVSLAEGIGASALCVSILAARKQRVDALALGAISVLGAADDLLESRTSGGQAPAKGLRGHLRALSRGHVTTGALKAAGIPLCAMVMAAAAPAACAPGAPGGRNEGRDAQQRSGGVMPVQWGSAVLIDAVVIAGMANLANLLDLRPGRALKFLAPIAVASAMPLRTRTMDSAFTHDARGTRESSDHTLLDRTLADRSRGGRTAARAAAVSIAIAAPFDLSERGMLGDVGANTLGAAVGAAASRRLSFTCRAALALALVGATFASEKVSFSAVIANTPVLHSIDQWGRRTPPPAS